MNSTYYVYIMTNFKDTVLYTGVTSDLEKRVWQHRNHVFEGFTSKYKVEKLIYFEDCRDINAAIAREKEIKGWSRAKKEALINKANPQWTDLMKNKDI